MREKKYDCNIPIARIDIFYDEETGGFKFCEFNTDGTSAMNEDRELKIEAYRETQLGVKPVASYERSCAFSSEYKAYFIDREQNLLGLAVCDWYYGRYSYLLLHFDGYAFHVLQEIPIPCTYDDVRADVIDGWLYLLGNELEVTQVW